MNYLVCSKTHDIAHEDQIELIMKNIEENKGQTTKDENISNMLLKTDNGTAVSSNPCLHATKETEEYSLHQLKNIGDKFQAISAKPPTPNQGNMPGANILPQILLCISINREFAFLK